MTSKHPLAFAALIWLSAITSAFAGKIGPEFQVNATTQGRQDQVAAAQIGDGGFVVFYNSGANNSPYGAILGQRFDAAAARTGLEFQVNKIGTRSIYPSATRLKNKGVIISWSVYSLNANTNSLYIQRYSADGATLGSMTKVNTGGTSQGLLAPIAALSNGGFVITWSDIPNGHVGLFARRYGPAGLPLGAPFQVSPQEHSTPEAGLAGLSDGGFVICWSVRLQNGVNRTDLFCQRYDAQGVKAGEFVRVNTLAPTASPSVTALAGGRFAVAWGVGGGGDIYARIYDAATVPLGPPFKVNALSSAAFASPKLATLSDNNFVVTWNSDDGVRGRRYNADGMPLGAEFPVAGHAFTLGPPAVAALPKRNFVIVYPREPGHTPRLTDVYGQRFGP